MKRENEIIEMAIANFENIEKMAEQLTSGNVSHNGATIKGIAHRNAEYLRNLRDDIKSYFEENSTCDSSGDDYDYDDPNDFADW